MQIQRSSYIFTRWIFLRTLGGIYFFAFASLGSQIPGLVGTQGILSCEMSDAWIQSLCPIGMLSSLLLIVGVLPVLNLALMWGIYFFLTQICQEFLSFQWDALLLEVGFLSILFAPLSFLPRTLPNAIRDPEPSFTWVLLYRWILFKVMFFSGWVKIMSGDPHWRNLTALTYHFETQPLPTWLGRYAHFLPLWFQEAACIGVFLVELICPFFIFFPKPFRVGLFFVLIGFQILLNLTGNYGFFGWLTATLCLLLIDDETWQKWLSLPFQIFKKRKESRFRSWIGWGWVGVVFWVSVFRFGALGRWASVLQIVNSYGVFAVMTTQRDEVIIEGSQDGQLWIAYEFKWKPGDLTRIPTFVYPLHMPRLDWQMWFAALGSLDDNPWLFWLMQRLLEGSPPVLSLFEKNPFVGSPPRYIRASRYKYFFVTGSETTGGKQAWGRKRLGDYSPLFSLQGSK